MVGLLWTSDQPVAEASTYTGQHNIYTQETNIHATSGIRIRDPSNEATANLRLRPRGHWDRLFTGWVTELLVGRQISSCVWVGCVFVALNCFWFAGGFAWFCLFMSLIFCGLVSLLVRFCWLVDRSFGLVGWSWFCWLVGWFFVWFVGWTDSVG
jgi:hypothetical protein